MGVVRGLAVKRAVLHRRTAARQIEGGEEVAEGDHLALVVPLLALRDRYGRRKSSCRKSAWPAPCIPVSKLALGFKAGGTMNLHLEDGRVRAHPTYNMYHILVCVYVVLVLRHFTSEHVLKDVLAGVLLQVTRNTKQLPPNRGAPGVKQ